MAIFYNGIQLGLTAIQEYRREPVYHHNKFLYVRHTFRARCVYNPNSTAYVYPGVRGAITEDKVGLGRFQNTTVANVNDVRGINQAGSQTDINILHALNTRGRQLIVTTEAIPGRPEIEWLVSPSRRPDDANRFYETDASGGPFPLGTTIVKRHANKTLEIDFAIRTDLTDCSLFSTSPSALLSHHWSMQRSVDQDFYATRTIRGEAVFRLDRLAQLSARADDYMTWLAHPMPAGFHRVHSEVVPSEDGTRVQYVLVDQEKPFTISAYARQNGVTRIECYVTDGNDNPGWLDTIGGTVLFGAGAVSTNPGGAIAAAVEKFMAVSGKVTTTLVVRVWGHRGSSRQQLHNVAERFIGYAMDDDSIRNTKVAAITQDVLGKFVEIKVSCERGPLSTFVDWVGKGIHVTNTRDLGRFTNAKDDVPNITLIAPGAQPFPPGDGYVRGTYTAALISQALAGSCTTLSEPTEPSRFVDRQP